MCRSGKCDRQWTERWLQCGRISIIMSYPVYSSHFANKERCTTQLNGCIVRHQLQNRNKLKTLSSHRRYVGDAYVVVQQCENESITQATETGEIEKERAGDVQNFITGTSEVSEVSFQFPFIDRAIE